MFRKKRNLSGFTISLVFVLALSTSFFLSMSSHARQRSVAIDSGVYYLPSQDNPEEDTYWTPERMKTVSPIDRSDGFFEDSSSLVTPLSQMAPKQILDNQLEPPVVKRDPTFPANFSGSTSKLPLQTTGKLLITFADGRRASCSGNALSSNNESVVNTAAHCLYRANKDVMAEKVIFCPQYEVRACPVGKWIAKAIIINPGYKDAPRAREDMGMIVVFPKKGKTLIDTVGGDGWMYNGKRFTEEKPFGYPSNIQKGQVLFTCPITLGEPFRRGSSIRKLPECEMGKGSSGGPWYTPVDDFLYVNGHNDIGPRDNSFIASPYYDDRWFANFDRAQNVPVT